MVDLGTVVTVPGDVHNLRVVRMLAADAADAANLGFDRITDLELAISEACTLLIGQQAPRLRCSFLHRPGAVEVEVFGADASDAADINDELSTLVLEATTDEYTYSVEDDGHVVAFRIGISDGESPPSG